MSYILKDLRKSKESTRKLPKTKKKDPVLLPEEVFRRPKGIL